MKYRKGVTMEQDINNLNEIINLCNEELDNKDENVTAVLDLADLSSLRNLIKAYKELEEKNKKNLIEIICYQEQLENSIPVSLVEENIEELNKEIKDFESTDKTGRFKKENSIHYYKREVLQELLEKRK